MLPLLTGALIFIFISNYSIYVPQTQFFWAPVHPVKADNAEKAEVASDSGDSRPGSESASESSSDDDAGPSAAQRLFGGGKAKASAAKSSKAQAAAAAAEPGAGTASKAAKAKAKGKTKAAGPGSVGKAKAGTSKPNKNDASAAATGVASRVPRASTGGEQPGLSPLAALLAEAGKEPKPSPTKQDMLLVDGRAKRAFKTLTDKADEFLEMLAKLDLGDSVPLAHERAAWKNGLAERVVKCKAASKGCKDLVRRMESSANKDSLSDPIERLKDISMAAQSFEKLLSVAAADQPDAEQMIQAYEASLKCCEGDLFGPEKALGPVFRLKYVMAKGNLHCLYQEYDKFSSLLLWKRDSLDLMESLAQALGREKLKQHVVAELENRLILPLRALPQSELKAFAASGKLEAGLLEACSLCEAFIERGSLEGENFIGHDLLPDLTLAHSVLTLGQKDLQLLLQAVAKFQELQAQLTDNDDSHTAGAVPRFFAQHANGKLLLDVACGRVEAGQKEAEAQQGVAHFKEALAALENPDPQLNLLADLLTPALEAYQSATKLVNELKKKTESKTKGLSQVADDVFKSLSKAKEDFVVTVGRASVFYLQMQFEPLL